MTRWPVNVPLVASIVAISIATLVIAAQLAELGSALLTPKPRNDPTRARLDDYLTDHGDAMTTNRARFDGRSVFFKPKAPPRPKPKRSDTVVRKPETPPPPPPKPTRPANYAGPSVSFVVGDQVWFHDGVYAMVGEEVNGVTVLASDPPWTVTLEYGGWEYDIKLFERKDIFRSRPTKTSNGSFPGIKPVEGSQ